MPVSLVSVGMNPSAPAAPHDDQDEHDRGTHTVSRDIRPPRREVLGDASNPRLNREETS
jgi:hypothetical protein